MKKIAIRNVLICLAAVGVVAAVLSTRNRSNSDTRQTAEANGKIDWMTSLTPALAKAKESNRPIMIDFFATWCPPCKMLDSQTYTDDTVAGQSKQFIMVRIDVDQNKELAEQYQISSIPTLVILNPEGKETKRQSGFMPPAGMLAFMESATPKAHP